MAARRLTEEEKEVFLENLKLNFSKISAKESFARLRVLGYGPEKAVTIIVELNQKNHSPHDYNEILKLKNLAFTKIDLNAKLKEMRLIRKEMKEGVRKIQFKEQLAEAKTTPVSSHRKTVEEILVENKIQMRRLYRNFAKV